MWIKKEKYNMLEKSIEKIKETIEKGNIEDLSYFLGNK